MPHQEVKKCSSCCSLNNNFTISGGKSHYAPDLKLEPKHLDISLEINIKKRFLDVSVVTTIECNQPEHVLSFNGIGFNTLTVQDITEENKKELKFTYDGKIIKVFWKNNLEKKEIRKIKFDYNVNQPVSGIQFSSPNEKKIGAYAITDHESERARYWLACIDYPTIRTSLSFHLKSSKDYSFFANGVLEKEEEVENNMKISHWNCDFICPSYLICFAIGEFIVVEDEKFENIPISYIAPKGTSEQDLKLTFDSTPGIVKWLQNKVGVKFPFPKYFQVIGPWVGGAMENISLVTWDYIFLLDEKLAKEWKWLVDIIVLHECTHSYFGDALVIRHFEHVWLKESWATYMEVCWLEDAYSKDISYLELYDEQQGYFNETKKYTRPIVTRQYDCSWNMFDRHTYPGGSWRLHMLKKLLGEDIFWSGVHNYVEKYYKKVVETDDFRKCLEEASGLNLTKFFDQWIYGKGYPMLEGKFNFQPNQKTCTISLKQTQEDNKKDIKLFNFDLDIEVTFEDGKCETKTVTFEDANVSVSFVSDLIPISIRIDPDVKMLFSIDFNPGEDILFNTLKNSKDFFNKIRSGIELIKIGTYSSLQKVYEAIKVEEFYGVRSVLAKELGDHKSRFTCDLLCKMLSSEKHPIVLTEITKTMIDFREEKIKNSLLEFLKAKNELFYFSHAFALQALATQRYKSSEIKQIFDLIVDHMNSDDRYSTAFVRRGAWRALSSLSKKHKECYEMMKNKVEEDDERNDSKLILIESFAQSASHFDNEIKKESKEILVELLRHQECQIRVKAIDGLITLKSDDKIVDIVNTKPTLPEFQHFAVDRKIKNLKESILETPSQVRKNIIDLQDKVRKIEDEFENLKNKK